MRLVQPFDAQQVGDHEAVEAPFAAQDVGQHAAVGRAGNAVHRVVGRHHRARSGLYGRFERRQVGLAQFAFAQQVASAVLAALRCAVGDEVLERREGVPRL